MYIIIRFSRIKLCVCQTWKNTHVAGNMRQRKWLIFLLLWISLLFFSCYALRRVGWLNVSSLSSATATARIKLHRFSGFVPVLERNSLNVNSPLPVRVDHDESLLNLSKVPTASSHSIQLTRPTTHRYVLQWFNWEQLTMATNNIITLAWFTSPWKASVVEPFTRNSKFFGFPSKKYTLFSIFDNRGFNYLLHKHNITSISGYSEFLNHASRRVILVHLLYNGIDLPRFKKINHLRKDLIRHLHKKGHITDCSQTRYMKKIEKWFLQYMNQDSSHFPFTVHHSCCINASHPTYSKEMLEKCHIPENGDVTVVFTDWKGVSPYKGFRLYAPEAKNVDIPRPSLDVYPYNENVLKNASAFLHLLTNDREFIGIHLRTEKLGGVTASYFDYCLNLTQSLKSSVLAKHNGGTFKVLYFADTGPYGSKSCIRKCLKKEVIEATFDKYDIQIAHYSPKKFRGISDSGFVATVEQETLSRATILVMVGGGSFQSQVITRYKNFRRDQPHFIHSICDKI